jgi:cytochrome c-type biogenesis protein
MDLSIYSLLLPTFIAGLVTFLAPCTLPLVPGYLGFISGVSLKDLRDPTRAHNARLKIFLNGLMYVVGFSAVFIVLGSLFGLGGQALAAYRTTFAQIGGLLVMFFGVYMLGLFNNLSALSFLSAEHTWGITRRLQPGNPASSFLFGATFAFGWTPCVGPILGSVLLLAGASATVGQGAFLLFVFSLGLAVPFLLIALGVGRATNYIRAYLTLTTNARRRIGAMIIGGGLFGVFFGSVHYLIPYFEGEFSPVFFTTLLLLSAALFGAIGRYKEIDPIGFTAGMFLIYIGILLLTDNVVLLIAYGYELFDFIGYEELLLDYL